MAAASHNPSVDGLLEIATDYIKHIKAYLHILGYTITQSDLTKPTNDGVYSFKLCHNDTVIGEIRITPFLESLGEYRPGPLKRGRESTITNVLHIRFLYIREDYRRMSLATTLILYSICCSYIINQDFGFVTVDDDTASTPQKGLPKNNIYLEIGFLPLQNLVKFIFKGKKPIITIQGKNSTLIDPGLYTNISDLIKRFVPQMKEKMKEKMNPQNNTQINREIEEKIAARIKQINAENNAKMNTEMNAGTRKTRRYRKKQKKTRRYRR